MGNKGEGLQGKVCSDGNHAAGDVALFCFLLSGTPLVE